MKSEILQSLQNLEKEQDICVLFAVESGSRAWGFASQDSDWDVRFVYVHRPEWYLSIDENKDSIEQMLPNDLDLAGWELRKALRLFRKSNPPMMEWLRSPLVYQEQFSMAKRLRELSHDYFNPKSCLYHYLSMANGNFRTYLQSELVKTKKYFYVLRPVLACQWIERNQTIPPMEFQQLVETQVGSVDLREIIEGLLARKMNGEELDLAPRIALLNDFLEERITHFQALVQSYGTWPQLTAERLNEVFRETLREVWS